MICSVPWVPEGVTATLAVCLNPQADNPVIEIDPVGLSVKYAREVM